MVQVPGLLVNLQRSPAHQTLTTLSLPEVLDPALSCKSMAHLPGHPFFQVQFPRRIVRLGYAPNLLPAKDPDARCFHQPDRPGFAFLVADHSGEYPVAVARTLEVFLPDPSPGLLSVPLLAPPPEFPEDAIVHPHEDATAHR